MATPFDVWATPVGEEALKGLNGKVKERARAKLRELEQQGCAAAGWRLQGLEGHICSVAIRDDQRLLTCFPSEHEVCVLAVGPHLGGPETPGDVYGEYYRAVGLEPPYPVGDPKHEQDCCDEGAAPVDLTAAEEFIAGAKALAKKERRKPRAGT